MVTNNYQLAVTSLESLFFYLFFIFYRAGISFESCLGGHSLFMFLKLFIKRGMGHLPSVEVLHPRERSYQ